MRFLPRILVFLVTLVAAPVFADFVTATGPYACETASAAIDSWLVIFRGGFGG